MSDGMHGCTCGATIYLVPVIGDFLRYQHGENPEHVMTITGLQMAAQPWDRARYATHTESATAYINRRLAEWVDAIHAFEQDGRWVGQPE